jgi:DNA primase
MVEKRDLLELAAKYHVALPHRIRQYLNDRGIPDVLVDFYLLGWNSVRITIPVFNREGKPVFFKLARDPQSRLNEPKMLASPGGYAELYGWNQVLAKPARIVICEGEFDRLVLENNGFPAVTSTGGAGTFRPEWANEFESIPEVCICFDRDEAGQSGALRVGRMIRHAKLIELPEEVGIGGDVTDFFVRLGKTKDDFLRLMELARPAPEPEPKETPAYIPSHAVDSAFGARVERVKRELPIADVIGQYVRLRHSYDHFTGLCPFHEDHNPSLTVYPATGTFHCFACRAHGDAIGFLMKIESLGFRQALEVLERLRNERSNQTDN